MRASWRRSGESCHERATTAGKQGPVFVDDELHQRAGVEIDDRRVRSAALFANEIGHRALGRDSVTTGGSRSLVPVGSADDALGHQPLEIGSGGHGGHSG
jgi:hypothetical protein